MKHMHQRVTPVVRVRKVVAVLVSLVVVSIFAATFPLAQPILAQPKPTPAPSKPTPTQPKSRPGPNTVGNNCKIPTPPAPYTYNDPVTHTTQINVTASFYCVSTTTINFQCVGGVAYMTRTCVPSPINAFRQGPSFTAQAGVTYSLSTQSQGTVCPGNYSGNNALITYFNLNSNGDGTFYNTSARTNFTC